jgi:hypothetical protein
MKILTSQYLENPFLDRHHTLYTVHLKEFITFMSFEVNASKFKGQTGHKKVLTAQYLGNPLLVGHQILYAGASYMTLILRFKLNIGLVF